MTDEGRQQGMTVADRRRFLQAMAAVAGLAASPAMAQSPGIADPKPMAMHGVLGAASAGPGRPKIAMLVHPRMVMQDFIGPLTVFNLIHSEIHGRRRTADPDGDKLRRANARVQKLLQWWRGPIFFGGRAPHLISSGRL
jgi:hypothetical protein